LRRYGKRNASNPGRADVAGFEVANHRDPKPVARAAPHFIFADGAGRMIWGKASY